jgi:hypothetical protein
LTTDNDVRANASGRGAVPCARYSCGPRERGPSPYDHRGSGTALRARSLGGERRPGGAQSPVPDILADRGDAVPPREPSWEGHCLPCPFIGRRTPPGRGAVLCARYSCGPWGHGPSQGTIVGGARSSVPVYLAAHAAFGGSPSSATESDGRANAYREGRSLYAHILADGGDAVPPSDPFREGHSPLCPDSCGPRGRGPSQGSIVGGARSSVPVHWAANAAREGRSPLCPIFLRTAGTRSLPGNHRGRGTVFRARSLGGERRPGGAQSPAPVFLRTARTPSLPGTSWEGHSPLCLLFLRTAGTRSLPKQPSWEGHGPPCLLFLRVLGTPSVPRHSLRKSRRSLCRDCCSPHERGISRGVREVGHDRGCVEPSGLR